MEVSREINFFFFPQKSRFFILLYPAEGYLDHSITSLPKIGTFGGNLRPVPLAQPLRELPKWWGSVLLGCSQLLCSSLHTFPFFTCISVTLLRWPQTRYFISFSLLLRIKNNKPVMSSKEKNEQIYFNVSKIQYSYTINVSQNHNYFLFKTPSKTLKTRFKFSNRLK